MKAADFLAGISSFFSSHRLDPDSGLIVAYSGGADSGALLAALSELGLKRLRAVHITHNIRPEAEGAAESALVKELCRSLGVPLTIARIGTGAIKCFSERKKIGMEAAARAFRYQILEKCARRFGCSAIATAHTLDDQLETLLARMLYSSGLEGLSGIPACRSLPTGIRLVRPLLFASRQDIEEYARSRSVGWVTDSSNADNQFLRNKLRNLIVPGLDSDFPGWRAGLLGTSRKIAEDRAAIAALLREALSACSFDSATRAFKIPSEIFSGLVRPLRIRLLRHAIGAVTSGIRLSSRALLDSVNAIEKGARRLEVLGAAVLCGTEVISVSPLLDFHAERGYFFMIASDGVKKAGGMEISAVWDAYDGNRMNHLLEGAFAFPIVVRSRRPGDSIVISGKSVRIDDLIKSWRLDAFTRQVLPVVEDERGIVAVMPDILRERDCLRSARFRDYDGRKDGRRLSINLKGALEADARR
jgi:tRNA(Ile)-lysidine synthase